jgi:hypothetical protein
MSAIRVSKTLEERNVSMSYHAPGAGNALAVPSTAHFGAVDVWPD